MNIATLEVIADRIIDLLREHGPLDEAELLDELTADEVDYGEYSAELFEQLYSYEGLLPLVRMLDDGRYCAADMILSGRTFTHRLSDAEIAGDCLELDADLHGVLSLDEDDRYQDLLDGGTFRHVMPHFDGELLAERDIAMTPANRSLVLLDLGALEGSRAGDLIAVEVTEDGFELESIAEADLGEPPVGLGAAVLDFVERHEGRPGTVWEIVLQLCADDPGLFIDPLRPFGELLAEFDVVVHQDAIARQGYDFEAARRMVARAAMMMRYGLSEVEAAAVDDYSGLSRALRAAEGPEPTAEIEVARQQAVAQLARIRSPEAAGAIAGALAFGGAEEARLQLEVMRRVSAEAPRSAQPVLAWVSAKAHESLGETLDAERLHNEALAVDPRWVPALYSLAGYALDRGDCPRALDLLHRARAPYDDALRLEAEEFTPPARAELGRNKPCWCGSGRKYKVCHLGKEAAPLAERAGWLYEKALRFAGDDAPRNFRVMGLEQRWRDEDESSFDVVGRAAVLDIALSEGGMFEQFVQHRSVLLPEDERALAAQWVSLQRSLFEVESVEPGVGLVLRDLRNGERCGVVEQSASRQLRPSELILARPLPAGDTTQFFGGISRVPVHARSMLIQLLDTDPEADEVVDFLAGLYAAPALVTREGEALELCEVQVRLPLAMSEPQVRSTLDSEFGPAEDASWSWLRADDGVEHLDGSVRLADGELVVEAMSGSRIDGLLDLLFDMLPGMTVLVQTRTPLDPEALRDRATGAQPELEQSPEMVEFMAQHMRDYEQRWLDMKLPALDGRTPRQAAANPTRREDLQQLLASLDATPSQPGGMSADRLRVLLGL